MGRKYPKFHPNDLIYVMFKQGAWDYLYEKFKKKSIATNHDRTEWTVQDRLQYREIRGIDNYQSVIGKKAKKLYKEANGKDPIIANKILRTNKGFRLLLASLFL